MAFPVVATVNGGAGTVKTDHTVNLPTGIASGNLLLVFFTIGGAPTITFPEGWTQLFQKAYSDYSTFGAWYRVADGTEESTITVTTSAASASAHTSYRITGYAGTPKAGTATVGNSTIPDPPSLTPTWGAKDTLWFAACAHRAPVVTVTAYPTNYTDGRNDYAYAGVGTARRELNAISEDPSAFTLSEVKRWVANTVAIQPPAAVGSSMAAKMMAAGVL